MAKEEPIVTFRTYYDPMLAHIERSRLEDAGINCFIQDENISTLNPFYNIAAGGIKLKVFERDIAACEAILSESVAPDNEGPVIMPDKNPYGITCSNCSSTNVRYGYTIDRQYNWWSMLLAVMALFSAIALKPFGTRKAWHCFNCGKDFEQQ
ncbi:DUF2007 domain-containing protein [Mucilaginibacter sp. HMF5004]|uniref:putative signal transducing protein n=1 Tax=Mucilaginibacter rivuli TaxID=2857527 RepID=UPI001C5F96E1|nr:DUF2007 domain-containing protein [Mucilaginibacter rivuli]MBW4889616.1 DUF2007 domain-containing protein [Mucilaginibacter rivuli]